MQRKPYKILIIDNDESLVNALAIRLEEAGHDCVRAFAGVQGIAEFNAQDIDLVITDLNMPLGTGIDLVQAVRRKCTVPVVVITGYRDEFQRELRSLRNVTVLRKPFRAADLIELIESELLLTDPRSDANSRDLKRAG